MHRTSRTTSPTDLRMNQIQTRLHDTLYKGTGPEIFLAVRARELHRSIATNADRVNMAGYGELFSALQNGAVCELTLSIAKLFERPSARYITRSIPSAIALLQAHAADLTPVEPTVALRDLDRIGISTNGLRKLNGANYTLSLASRLGSACPDVSQAFTDDLSRALDALRVSRDKTIAHNEAIDRAVLPSTSWADVENLILFAKHTHAALAMAYFGSIWTDDIGTFLPDSEARIASMQLNRVVATIGPDASQVATT